MLQVAVPLVVSTVSMTVMTFVDRMFLNWVSGTAMSAAFSATIIWFAFFCLPTGICGYVNTFVSQYHGNKQPKRIGPSVWQGVWVAVVMAPFSFALIPAASWIFAWARHSPEVTQFEITYFQILCVGGPAMLAATALSAFYSGRGKTWVVMLVDAGVVVLNLVLDYLWIFGYAGFPEMGIAGAGWATVTALWVKAVIYLLLVLQKENRKSFDTGAGLRFDRELFRRLLSFGGPSGVQLLLDMMGFTVFVVLIGRVGNLAADATTLAFSIAMVAFMPILGVGMGVSVLVGQHLGENRDDLAARATWTALQISWTYMVLISALYIFVPDLFLYGFFAQNNASPADKEALHTTAVNLLKIVAAYNMMDAMFMIFASAVKGAGDTRFVMRASMVMGSVLVLLSWLTIVVFKLSVYGCWITVTVWVCTNGIIFLIRFLGGRWRSMRVIELREEPLQSTPAVELAIEPAE